MLLEAGSGLAGVPGLAVELALVLFGALKGRGQRNITWADSVTKAAFDTVVEV